MSRLLLVSGLVLLLAILTEPPAQSRDEKVKPCVGVGCGKDDSECVGIECKDRQQQRPIEIHLSVSGKSSPTAGKDRINFGEMLKLTAAVTGLLPQYRPDCQFAVWGANVVVEYGTPIETSGEFIPSSSWGWTPTFTTGTLAGFGVKFIVTMRVSTAEGEIVQTAQTGTYHIVDDALARQLYSTHIGPVVTFHRCANCHNAGDSPTQGDDRHLHTPTVNRQTDCRQCHGNTNGTNPGTPPGAPGHWRMPPPALSFANKSAAQICRQIKDPAQNGGRSLEELRDHVRTDHIIKWTWNPGPGRTKSPGTWESVAFDGNSAFQRWVRIAPLVLKRPLLPTWETIVPVAQSYQTPT